MKKRTRSSKAAGSTRQLLDTSTLLWILGAPERLSGQARARIDEGENLVSVASYWEVVIKVQKGGLTIPDVPTWWRRALEASNARVLPIRASHVTALLPLPEIHKDPFDRMLVAQAIAEGLAIVTNDDRIAAYPVRTIW